MDIQKALFQRRFLVAGSSVCLILALVVACSSDTDKQATSTNVVTTPVGNSTVELPTGITEVDFSAYLSAANDFVRPIIEDGDVTADEYELAVFRVLQCLDEQGVLHSEPILRTSPDGPRWTYTVGPSGVVAAEEQSRIHDECDTDYLRVILTFWEAQSLPSESDLQQRDRDYLVCLQVAGLDVGSVDEAESLFREGLLSPLEVQERIRCRLRVYEGVEVGP